MQILDSLIEEDDSVPNVWYMLAMCLLGGGQTEAAAEALQHGQKLLKKQRDTDELAQDFKDLKVHTSHTVKLLLHTCQLMQSQSLQQPLHLRVGWRQYLCLVYILFSHGLDLQVCNMESLELGFISS